jgi:diadenosine tetraphosphate (Ap4A) HIT family hydrolase
MKKPQNYKGQFVRIKTQDDYMFLFQMQDKYIQNLFNMVAELQKKVKKLETQKQKVL